MGDRFLLPGDVLLGDVFALVARFLGGFDLLRLSHTNRRLLTELLAPDSDEWRRRLPPTSSSSSYSDSSQHGQATARLARPSSERAEISTRDRGGAVEVWSKGLPAYWVSESFAFAITFALLPGDAYGPPASHVGGVLLGAQSVPWSSKRWPDSPQQFVHVSPQGDLYCSVLDQKPAVARSLALRRWYHVALVFDRRRGGSGVGTQRVFLDGELCHEAIGTLHSEWWNLRFGQLGSGCMGGTAPGSPTPGLSGWYGFHGVIDDCRLWCGDLRQEDVQRVAHGQELVDKPGCQVTWSLRESGCDPLGLAAHVRCTRPQERVCTDVQDVTHDAFE